MNTTAQILPQSPRDDEMVVLASLICEQTATEASKIVTGLDLSPARMFSCADLVENYIMLRDYGSEVFEGYLCTHPVAALAKADVSREVTRIISHFRQRMAEMDRPLNLFEAPPPDEQDPDCLFQGRWLRRGQCGAIVSTSGVGKSSLTMQASTAWAAGEDFLGIHPMKPLKIGIFQSEDDEYDVANFRDRIRIGLAKIYHWDEKKIQDAESRVTFCALDGSTGMPFINHLQRKIIKHHFDLIIINPLFAFFGNDTNDGAAMTEFLRHGIDPLIKNEKTKCACLIVHHTAKPNKDALAAGEVFAAYLGSGSSEFTNYIRSALVLTPYQQASGGVFNLIAAKHGDKLGWRDENGAPTIKKIAAYANKLPELADTGMIFWIEPTPAELAEIKGGSSAGGGTASGHHEMDICNCASALAVIIRDNWSATKRPQEAKDGQKKWVTRLPNTPFTRRLREEAYEMLLDCPQAYGLKTFSPDGRSIYLVPAEETITPTQEALEW